MSATRRVIIGNYNCPGNYETVYTQTIEIYFINPARYFICREISEMA